MKKKDLVLGAEYAFSVETDQYSRYASVQKVKVIDLNDWEKRDRPVSWSHKTEPAPEYTLQDGRKIWTRKFEPASERFTKPGARRVLVEIIKDDDNRFRSFPYTVPSEHMVGAVLPRHIFATWEEYVERRDSNAAANERAKAIRAERIAKNKADRDKVREALGIKAVLDDWDGDTRMVRISLDDLLTLIEKKEA